MTPRRFAARLALVLLPFAVAAGYIALLAAVLTVTFFHIALGAMVAYLVTPAGAEIVIPSSVVAVGLNGGGGFEAFMTIASVVLVDVFSALFLLWNFDLAEKTPFLGAFIERTEDRCRAYLARKPARQKLAVVALALYVALPFQMSGGVVGSILGRVMGLERHRVFAVVALSSAAGAVPIGLAAYVFGGAIADAFRSNAWYAVGVVLTVAFLAAIVIMYRRSRGNRVAETG